jgi:hypothetical protein
MSGESAIPRRRHRDSGPVQAGVILDAIWCSTDVMGGWSFLDDCAGTVRRLGGRLVTITEVSDRALSHYLDDVWALTARRRTPGVYRTAQAARRDIEPSGIVAALCQPCGPWYSTIRPMSQPWWNAS